MNVAFSMRSSAQLPYVCALLTRSRPLVKASLRIDTELSPSGQVTEKENRDPSGLVVTPRDFLYMSPGCFSGCAGPLLCISRIVWEHAGLGETMGLLTCE